MVRPSGRGERGAGRPGRRVKSGCRGGGATGTSGTTPLSTRGSRAHRTQTTCSRPQRPSIRRTDFPSRGRANARRCPRQRTAFTVGAAQAGNGRRRGPAFALRRVRAGASRGPLSTGRWPQNPLVRSVHSRGWPLAAGATDHTQSVAKLCRCWSSWQVTINSNHKIKFKF